MARFYQTATPQFVDDFIYQPNWELASQVLQKKDNDINNQIEMISILGNPEIEFVKESDGENVQQIKNEYESRADEIAEYLQNNLNNPLQSRKMISSLKRDLSKDYSTGRIRNIQDNFKAYNDFNERLSKLSNPADREAYKQAWGQYLSENSRGALDSVFSSPEMYATRNLTQEFLASDSFKNLKASVGAETIDKVDGKWIARTGNKVQELPENIIQDAYKGFINNDGGLEGYINSRQKYFGETDWLNEDGELNWEETGRLGRDLKTLSNYAYKNVETSKTLQANPYEQANHASALRLKEAAQKAHLEAQLATKYGTGKGAKQTDGQVFYNKDADFFKYTAQGKELINEYNTTRRNVLTSLLNPKERSVFESKTPKQQQEFLSKLENERLPALAAQNPAVAQRLQILNQLDTNFDNAFQVGFGTYAQQNFSDKELKQIQDHYASDAVGVRVDKALGHWNFGARPDGGYYTSQGTRKGTPENNRNIIGKRYNVPGPLNGAEVVDIKMHPKSALPWMPITSGKGFQGATLDYDITLKVKGSPVDPLTGKQEIEDTEITVPATWYATDYQDLLLNRK